jgi:Putative DNA-binding domain
MALMHLPLEQVQRHHLQSLIDRKAADTLTIEYKRETYGGNDDARAEFLADVSSFANTSGGDLVIGIDAKEGIPVKLTPFIGNVDAELRRLDQMAQNGLEPRVQKLQKHAVPIDSGGSVLIFRAARSYSAPHRVIFKGKNRFWARSSASARKYEPNVEELRAMFTLAPQLAERMRDFRIERIARIAAGDTPVRLLDERCLVLHVVPFSAFDLRPPFSLQTAIGLKYKFFPMGATAAQDCRINFDGFLTLSNSGTHGTKQRAYVQVFRTGAIEAVASPVVHGQDGINAQTLEAMIVKYTRIYAAMLHECGAEPPLAVMVSLIGVKDRELVPGFPGAYDSATAVIDRDQLHCAEVILEEVPSGDPDCAKILRETLDQLANAAGRSSSASFDASGNFRLGRGGHL